MKKGHWVLGPKFYILGAGSQNANLPVKMLKIEAFRPGSPQDVKNFHFFSKTLVWDQLATFNPVPGCPPDITLKKGGYSTVLIRYPSSNTDGRVT